MTDNIVLFGYGVVAIIFILIATEGYQIINGILKEDYYNDKHWTIHYTKKGKQLLILKVKNKELGNEWNVINNYSHGIDSLFFNGNLRERNYIKFEGKKELIGSEYKVILK